MCWTHGRCVLCGHGTVWTGTSVESVDTMECEETPSPHNTAADGWGHSHHRGPHFGAHGPATQETRPLLCVPMELQLGTLFSTG